ncbi:MAG: hypothetical protein II393_00475 [Cytophagales bacterium]|nr:hypothetical protein [Cytophagales bacterium]MBQ5917785.1 hypothetical protein [Lachnospiraceae bacterium]
MKKKKVKAPKYEQLADTQYITGLREDLPTYRDQYNYMLGQLDVTSPEVQQAFQDKANEYTQAQWNDFNRNALANYKAMNQANRNRFGNLGSSGAMYGADTYNRQLNDLATRIAGQTAGQYENLMNNYYTQKLNTAQLYGNTYFGSGGILQDNDIENWKIRNRNIEAKYAADVQNANRGGFNLGNALSGAASGALMGSKAGPWGALIGGVAGGAVGGFTDSGNQASQLGANLGGIYPSIRSSYGTSQPNLTTQANMLNLSTPTNYQTYAGGRYRW